MYMDFFNMNIIEILAIVIFYLSLSSYGLILDREKTPPEERIGMFSSEIFTNLVFFPSFVLMIISGIILFLYSWKALIIIFIITALLYPFIGRFLITHFWSIPYYFLNKQSQKKLNKK